MIRIINLTPHPVTICRSGCSSVTYPAPTRYKDNPTRAIESSSYPADLDPLPMHLGFASIGIGDLALAAGASGAQDGQGGRDSQGAEQNVRSLQGSGIVDFIGYSGAEGLPEASPYDRMFGFDTFWIVSIETALGAAAAGRGIEDLLIPTGRILDADGEIVGVAALSPATAVLSPLYRRWTTPPAPGSDARPIQPRHHERGATPAITTDNLTDEQIRAALDALPRDHYSRQWYVDALGSEHHPQRRANARRAVAELLNTEGAEARRQKPHRMADDDQARATAAPDAPTREP